MRKEYYQKSRRNWTAIAVIVAALIVVLGFIGYFEFKEQKAKDKAKAYYERMDKIHKENEKKSEELFKKWDKEDKEMWSKEDKSGN